MSSPYRTDEEAPGAFQQQQRAPPASRIDHRHGGNVGNGDDDASSYVSKEGSSKKSVLVVAMAICAFLFGGGIVAGIWAVSDSVKDDAGANTGPANTNAGAGGGGTAPTPPTQGNDNPPTLRFTFKPTNRPTIPPAPTTTGGNGGVAPAPPPSPGGGGGTTVPPRPTPPPTLAAPQAPVSDRDRLFETHGPLWQDTARWLFNADSYRPSGYDDLAERYALAVLFDRTSGGNLWNFKTGWLSSASVCDGWHGITCDPSSGRVVGIEFEGNSLVGTLPTELGILSALTSITITNSFELTGSLPTEVSLLTALRQMNIRNNYLTGSIPDQISNLRSLTKLDLENNVLSGGIPGGIGALIDLRQLSAGGNELSGSIPGGVSDLTNLLALELDANRLVGTLPDLSPLRSLEMLILKTNKLSGNVPVLPDSLQFCDLDWNNWSNTDNGVSKGCF